MVRTFINDLPQFLILSLLLIPPIVQLDRLLVSTPGG